MAKQLMKLLVNAATTTNTNPDVTRFFYVATADTPAESTLTIDVASFFLDDGTAATTLPPLAAGNSYYNVFINGVLQMEDISTYTEGATTVGSLAIAVPTDADPLLQGTPIVLEVVNFAPSSTTDVTT